MAAIDQGAEVTIRRETWASATGYFIRRYPLGAAGAVIVTTFVAMALFAPWITQFDPTATNPRVSLAYPSGAHILGADFMGRDMWSRIVYGARISLAVGIGSTTLGCLFGVTIGLTSGLFRRLVRPDRAALHGRNAVAAAPGDGAGDDRGARARRSANTIIAISIPLVPSVARVIRSNTLMLREMPYVEAARAVGMNEFSIALRHVLPNTLAPLIVLATRQLGSTILVEAALSFLGLGVPEPHPSWGRMLSESAAEYVRVAPWLVIFPGAAISLAVFGTNLLGDALRDILDPRQRD
jgi:peptide/nickel transport system permease protein